VSVAAEPSALSAPYRGLSPFGESDLDALLFFGRERETEIATANLIASRLTVLYGPSGVGKTSLLRAGVARRVRELGGLRAVGRGPDLACVVFSSWAGDPARALAEAIEAEVAPLVSPIAPRPPAGVSLAEVVEHWTVVLDGDLCLVLDQLEEYFVYHDAQALVEELAAVVLRPDLRANVLLSLRDDALADLDVFKARIPTVFANSLRLDRLDRQAATAAIIGPAQRWNVLAPPADRVDIEPELVDDVLAQSAVAGDAARVEAPYLQLVMERVWNEEHDRGSRMLRASTLAALGGAGAIVRDHLDRALNALDDDAQNAAALMFEHLVTPSGTKIAHRASDLAQFARIPAATAAPVLGALGRERILRPLDDTDAGGDRYEIFHDVLAHAILEWRRRREVEHERVVARRRQRRLGALLAAAVVLLLLMTGVTAYAFDQRREARTQAERALVAQDVAQKNARTAAREAVEAEKQRKRAQDARKATAKALKRQQQLTHGIALALEKKTAAENEAVAQKKVANEEKDSAEQHAHAEQVQRRNAEKQAGFAALAAQRAKKKQIEADRARSAAQRAEDRAERLLKRARRGENNALLASKKAREAKDDAVAAAREAEATAGAFHALSLVYRYPETTVELALQAEQEGARKALVTQALRRGLLGLRGTRIIDAGGPTHAPVPAAVYDTSGTRILTGSTVDARLFDAATGNLLRTLRPTPASSVTTVAFSPDSRLAATGLADGRVIVWDLPSGSPHVPLRHDGAITSLSFSPDGTRLATGSADGAFGIWDVGTGISLKDVKLGGRVRSVAFSSNGTKILVVAALANVQKPARLYDATGDSFIGFSQTDLITTATLSSDGKLLATGGRDKFVVLWDAETGEQIKRFTGHSAEIYSVTFSPNGDRLASTSYDDTVRIWDTRALEFKGLLVGHVATVVSAAYSRDGSRIVTAGTDRTARVWQAEGGDQSVLLGHTEAVNTAVFSPDGSRVLTASDDGTARLWTSLSEPALVQLGRHDQNRGGAFGASFSDNGQRLATAGADGSVRVWDPTRPAAVARLMPVWR